MTKTVSFEKKVLVKKFNSDESSKKLSDESMHNLDGGFFVENIKRLRKTLPTKKQLLKLERTQKVNKEANDKCNNSIF